MSKEEGLFPKNVNFKLFLRVSESQTKRDKKKWRFKIKEIQVILNFERFFFYV
jgi:hypothetical protein